MKKLMIAAAIVCAAVASQAAAFTWSSATTYGPAAANLTKVGTYAPGSDSGDILFMESMMNSMTWTATMEITSSLGNDSFAFDPIVGYGTITGNLSSDKIANGTDTDPVTATARVILQASYTIDGVDYTMTSNEIVAQGEFKELTSLAFSAGAVESWTVASAVPEPTSGLLLLLGVAGLALRRRRA